MEKQLTIFDILMNKEIKKIKVTEELKELSNNYLIDSHYKKITFGKTLTISQIAQSLMRLKEFPEYIEKVYEILAKHYEIVDSQIGDFDLIGIEKLDNSIRIYQPRMQYSIFCISMIDSEFYQYANDN